MIQIDVQMPKNCSECPCNNDYMNCGVTGTSFYNEEEKDPLETRPDWCPLKEVTHQ